MKKKRTIRFNYMIILAGTVAAVAVVCWLVMNMFLEPYYVRNKQSTLVSAYEMMKDELNEDHSVTEDMERYLVRLREDYNVDTYLWDSSQNIIYSSNYDRFIMRGNNSLYDYIFGRQDSVTVLESTADYQINETYDSALGTYYMEMFSIYPDGELSIMRTPIQSIQETVGIVSRLVLYVVIGVGIVGILAAWFITRRMTKPILELASVAERMAGLDFTARYSGKGNRETALLGASMNDMSERLEKTIEELKSANLELVRDIEAKTRIDESRREFLSDVSHELKTPISLIQGYAEGLKEGISDDPETTKWYCEVIIDEAQKMNTMVQKLLALNRIEDGGEKLSLMHFDVVELAKGILASFDLPVRQREARMELHAPQSLYIWADEYMTEEVIRNYVSNAVDHADGEKLISVTVEEDDGRARISVFNTGEKIPDEDIEKVWDKFYKVDKARTREYGGSGIGLSIVKAVMEAHGGTYGVNNEDNGVTFFCEFDCG